MYVLMFHLFHEHAFVLPLVKVSLHPNAKIRNGLIEEVFELQKLYKSIDSGNCAELKRRTVVSLQEFLRCTND